MRGLTEKHSDRFKLMVLTQEPQDMHCDEQHLVECVICRYQSCWH